MAKDTGKHQSAKTEPTSAPDYSYWSPGVLYWGLLIVLIGILLLLDSLDIVTVQIDSLWQLWPMAVIGIGISLLRPRNVFSKLLTWLLIAVLLVMACFIALYPTSQIATDQSATSDTIQPGVTNAEVSLHTSPGGIRLSSDDVTSIVDAELDSDIFELKQTSTTNGDTQYVAIKSVGREQISPRKISSDLSVSLTEKIPVKLNLNTGASRISGDLSNTQLTSLNVKAGASDINLTLPEPKNDLNVRLDIGASSTTLRIPKDAALQVKSGTGLTKTFFEGLDDKGEGVYESPDFARATNKITIEAKMGVSNFTITRY